MDYVKAYTTNKVFNFDDVMNAAILKLVFPNIKIKRVENPKDFADERSIIYGEDFLILGKQSIHFKGELFYEICNNFLVPYLNNIHIEDYDYYYDNLLIIFEMSAGKKYIIELSKQNEIYKLNDKYFYMAVDIALAEVKAKLNYCYKEDILAEKEYSIWSLADYFFDYKVKYLNKSINYFKFKDEFDGLVLIINKSNRGYMLRSVNWNDLIKCEHLFTYFDSKRNLGICNSKSDIMKAAKEIIEKKLYRHRYYYNYWY